MNHDLEGADAPVWQNRPSAQETPMTTDTPIAVVTGGSRGLGRNTALKLAAHGVDVLLTYRSNRAEADSVVSQVTAAGRRAVALPLDVAASGSFAAFAMQVSQTLAKTWQRERFNFLVNNAGTGVHASFLETTEAQFDELVNIHLKGTFFLTQKLLPLMADGGRIINLSSGLTRFAFPGFSAYAAMKGGIEVLTRYMAKELGARRITVNTLAPGAIETDFGGGMVRDNQQVNAGIASQTALGRVGLPDDIGGVVASLLAAENGWVNGQRIEASGGVFL
jgi:NAD(P)-dependent dehydrogenase (short-subunit alcohol dehydrogenase family)